MWGSARQSDHDGHQFRGDRGIPDHPAEAHGQIALQRSILECAGVDGTPASVSNRRAGVVPHVLLALQRRVGNQATSGLIDLSRDEDNAPKPVGFGQQAPEVYTADFLKDSEPGVTKFFRVLASAAGWTTIYHVIQEVQRQQTGADKLQVIIRAGLLGGVARGDLVADLLPQSWLIELSQREVDNAGPLARQHLDHYLAGTGTDFVEDVARLYREDDGFRAETERLIGEGAEFVGVGSIPQICYANREWQYALGAVDEVHWDVLRAVDDTHAEVKIRIRDPYQWHPDEYRTWGSHLGHVALERAKENGAREYLEVGEATITLDVGSVITKKLRARGSDLAP